MSKASAFFFVPCLLPPASFASGPCITVPYKSTCVRCPWTAYERVELPRRAAAIAASFSSIDQSLVAGAKGDKVTEVSDGLLRRVRRNHLQHAAPANPIASRPTIAIAMFVFMVLDTSFSPIDCDGNDVEAGGAVGSFEGGRGGWLVICASGRKR
mmetsp:Transcript_48980/g.97737  ORF Transcript_48980/g.97737 Transcript_48980/m.97737 type:complete len:155 (-) Transcript_48980:193-657(-)